VWSLTSDYDRIPKGRIASCSKGIGRALIERAFPAGRGDVRSIIGDESAVDAARVLAVGIENPHLLDMIDPHGRRSSTIFWASPGGVASIHDG